MELHSAIRNILKYQGKDFLTDSKMINALIDFRAYEDHPALKNIFRALHQDGYVAKITQCLTWDFKCDQMVYEVERDYAFPKDLVEYVLKSVAYGIGALNDVTVPTTSNQSGTNPQQQGQSSGNTSQGQNSPSQPSNPSQPQGIPSKPWIDLTVEEREKFLNSLIRIIRPLYGLKYESVYISDNTYDDDTVDFYVNYEVSGKPKKDGNVDFSLAIYDINNRLRKHETLGYIFFEGKGKRVEVINSSNISLNFDPYIIDRILIYMQK